MIFTDLKKECEKQNLKGALERKRKIAEKYEKFAV